jgi:enoyl-CoA hydratase/carnithine racemase
LRLRSDVEGAVRPLHKHLLVALHEVLDGAEARRVELAPRVVQHRLRSRQRWAQKAADNAKKLMHGVDMEDNLPQTAQRSYSKALRDSGADTMTDET